MVVTGCPLPPWKEADVCKYLQYIGGHLRFEYIEETYSLRIWSYNSDVTGWMGSSWHSRDYKWVDCISLDEQLEFVMDCIEEEAIHEVRERFTFCDVRIFDPHVGPGCK